MSGQELRNLRSLQLLKEMGLTEYEALIYLALLIHGELTAKKLSEVTGVPYTRVYDVVRKLEERGWVQVLGRRPLTCRARPIEEVTQLLLRDFARRTEILRVTVEKEVTELRASRGTAQVPAFVVYDLQVLRTVLKTTMESTEEVLRILVTNKLIVEALTEVLRVRSRNFTVRVLVGVGAVPEDLVQDLRRSCEVRFASRYLPIDLVIRDTNLMVLVLGPLIYTGLRPYAVVLTVPDLINLALQYFDYMWEHWPLTTDHTPQPRSN